MSQTFIKDNDKQQNRNQKIKMLGLEDDKNT